MRENVPSRVALLLATCCCSLVASSQIYKWNTIQFEGLTRDVDTIVDGDVYHNEESVVMTGAHYDVETGFVCAAFPRVKPSVPVTVGCFSTDEYDQMSAPKFTAFPSVADNDLPDWPEAKLPLYESRRYYNYRQARGRKNFTNTFYRQLEAEESSGDSDWINGGVYALRLAGAEEVEDEEQSGKVRGFTGFNSLSNLLVKKDKKDVVVAVVHDENPKSYTPYEWSSTEDSWRPQHHHKQPEKKPSKEPLHAYVVVPEQEQHEEKKNFFRFFSKIGDKFQSVFKKKQEKPEYHLNVNYHHSNEGHHGHHQHGWDSSEENGHGSGHGHGHHGHGQWKSSEEIGHGSGHGHGHGHHGHGHFKSSEEDRNTVWSPNPHHKKHKTPQHYESEEYYHHQRPNKKKTHGGPPLYYGDDSREFNHRHHDYNAGDQKRNLNGDRTPDANKGGLSPQEQQQLAALLNMANGDKVVQSAGDLEDEIESPEKMPKAKISRPYNFISVHNVRFDRCGRLWFIDVGTVETKTNPIFYRSPILWAFEVKVGAKGGLISRPYIRHEMEDTAATGLRSLVVDIHEDCEDYHVYMPNSKDNRIVVYSSTEDRHWQFQSPTMEPVQKESSFSVQDEEYQMVAGVTSLTMGPRDAEGLRDVYFTPASGTGQFRVSTRLLREQRAAPDNFSPSSIKFLGYRGEGEGLTQAQVYDPRTDVIFSASMEDPSIRCWNSNKLLTPDSYGTAYSHLDMVFGADISLDRKGNLWTLSNNYPAFWEKGLDVSAVNFSLFRVKPRDVVVGTVCAGNTGRRSRSKADDQDDRFDGEKKEAETVTQQKMEEPASSPAPEMGATTTVGVVV